MEKARKHIAVLGTGSNLGDRKQNLDTALGMIREISGTTLVKQAKIYETEPVGYKDQGWFFNSALTLETELSAHDLFISLKAIEKKMGRTPTIQNGPRVIDLDLLFYDDMVIRTKELVIPHPRLHERLFVLAPLMDIEKDFVHPVLRQTIHSLFSAVRETSSLVRGS